MNLTRRVVSMMALAGVLAACGGGGDDPTAAVPARAGSADIGPAGGSVDAVLEGGATVQLDLPAGALAATTTLRIDPAIPTAGTLGAFTLSPSGIALLKPATLRVTLPAGKAPDPDTSLLIDAGTRRIPLGRTIDPSTRTLSVRLDALILQSAAGVLEVSPGRSHALAAGSTTRPTTFFNLAAFGYAARLNIMEVVVSDLAADGSNANAINVREVMESVLGDPRGPTEPRVHAVTPTWRNVVCGQQQSFVGALNTFSGVDIQTFEQRAKDVLAWDRHALDLNALDAQMSPPEPGCAGVPADIVDPVRAQLPTFLADVRQALALLDPNVAADYTQLFGVRFQDMANLAADFGRIGADDLEAATLGVVFSEMDRVRAAGYAACRSNRDQSVQAKLLKEALLNEVRAPFHEQDVLEDVQFCGMGLHWKLLDAQGSVMQQGDAGGIGPGANAVAATLRVAGSTRLSITGPLGALVCPAGSQNNEQLVFASVPAAGAAVPESQLTPSNTNGYLQVSGLDIDIPAVLSHGATRVRVARQGGVCNGEFLGLVAHATIATFSLDPSTLQVTTTALPGATVGVAYATALSATGGTLPFVWSATGVPAGLSLNSQTGALSGTPTNVGTSSLAISVVSAEGFTAQATLTLTVAAAVVVPDVSGSYAGTHVDNTTGQSNAFSTTVRQSGNLVLIGNGTAMLCSMAPDGSLTFLGFSDGGFVVNPAIRVTQSFTGLFGGPSLGYRLVDLIAGSDGSRDDDSFFLSKQ